MQNVMNAFPITEQEYTQLDEKFISLCHYQAWQLLKMNANNNCTDDQEDIVQDLRIALIRAGSYYKRQTYIEQSLNVLYKHVRDPFNRRILRQLRKLWNNRKRHGANRQKFGDFQEIILDDLIQKYVPRKEQPKKDHPLNIDPKFIRYCKQITWNELKLKGKQITRDKSWRTGLASLSEYEYLGA